MSRDDLFKAIDVADEARLREILAQDPALAGSRSEDGMSAILFTLYLAKYDLTKALLEQQPALDQFELAALNMPDDLAACLDTGEGDIDAMTGDGFSALHLACFFGAMEAAALLVERGANVNIHADNGTDLRPLHSACAAGHGAIVSLLLNAGAKVNVAQAGGYTPLMAAASLGNAPVVDMLLEKGADKTIQADDKRTAVDFAAATGLEALVEKLT
ncbi:ankyrin repeat domain-containing protein [Paremcibacter congregatus]|uniref:ankyrin repeat domain-containing protein n=1 Tax=Paremcibacter congregatus TaxID=2043170 RepID=UPI003A9342FC